MHKFKPISKSMQHQDPRVRQEREEKREKLFVATDSDEDSSEELQQIDFNCSLNRQEQAYSIQEFIENLQAQSSSHYEHQQPNYLDIEQNISYFYPNNYHLDKINADYMSKMDLFDQKVSKKGGSIRFESKIRVKFFNDESAVSQICDTQQFTTTIQYQQQSDGQVQ